MSLSTDQIAWMADFFQVSKDVIAADPDLARKAEILEDMEDADQTFDGERREVDDGPSDPDLIEPQRMPELDKGPMPDQRLMPMDDIKYTQNNISGKLSDGRPLDTISDTMEREGWDPNSPDPDMVQNESGGGTTLDHRRLVGAKKAGMDEVPAKVHGPDDPLPEEMEGRFKLDRDITDADGEIVMPKGKVAETWGEAAKIRAANQKSTPAYEGDETYTDETYDFPPEGDARQPYIEGKMPTPAEEAKAAAKAAKEAVKAAKDAQDPAKIEAKDLGKPGKKALDALRKSDPEAAKAIEDVLTDFKAAEARREADLDPDLPRPPEPDADPDPTEPEPTEAEGRSSAAPDAERVPPEPGAPEPGAPEPAPPESVPTEPAPASSPTEPVTAGGKPAPAGAGAPEAEAAAGADAGAGAAIGAGAVGGLMTGGATLLDDFGKVRSGQMSVGDAAKDVGTKTVEGGGLTYVGAKVAETVVKGAGAEAAAASSGAEGALAGAGAEVAAAGSTLASVASKGGVIGGVVAGGMALIDDVGQVLGGKMTAGTATVDVGVKAAVGVGAGMAGAAAGAEIGALAGSVVPGVGNVVGFVAGAVVGGAVGYVGNKIMETETGREIVHAAGEAVDAAIDGVEVAGKAVAHGAEEAGEAVASAAGAAVEGVEHAAGAVADAASSAAGAAEDAASSVLDGASSLFGKIEDAL